MAVVVFGSINTDLALSVATLPKPGETVLTMGYEAVAGGKGCNQSAGASADNRHRHICFKFYSPGVKDSHFIVHIPQWFAHRSKPWRWLTMNQWSNRGLPG